MHFDLLIIGGGPAGHSAAQQAAKADLSVALVEKHHLGGTCLNVGCIPTKVLLGATSVASELKAQQKKKLCTGEVTFDMAALQKRKDRLVGATRQAIEKELAGLGVAFIRGVARFAGPAVAIVETEEGEQEITFEHAIVATGTAPAAYPGLTPDGRRIFDSDGLLSLEHIPDSIIILGGGAIGIELGEWLSRIGTNVTLVEAMDRLAPMEDPEVSALLKSAFSRDGWKIHLGKRASALQSLDEGVRCELEDGTELEAEIALVALGRTPTTETIGAAACGMHLDSRAYIIIDENLRATDTIYAVGDVNGRALWAHAASHQSRYAVSAITGETSSAYEFPPMPGCIYGTHEVMRVGATAAELSARPGELAITKAPLAANPLVQAHGASQGLVKCFWLDERLAGITAMGWNVSHLVTLSEHLVEQSVTREQARTIIFAHPTLDESLEFALVHAEYEKKWA